MKELAIRAQNVANFLCVSFWLNRMHHGLLGCGHLIDLFLSFLVGKLSQSNWIKINLILSISTNSLLRAHVWLIVMPFSVVEFFNVQFYFCIYHHTNRIIVWGSNAFNINSIKSHERNCTTAKKNHNTRAACKCRALEYMGVQTTPNHIQLK